MNDHAPNYFVNWFNVKDSGYDLRIFQSLSQTPILKRDLFHTVVLLPGSGTACRLSSNLSAMRLH